MRASGRVENAFHYIDLASSFFQLVPGPNTLNTTATTIAQRQELRLRIKPIRGVYDGAH
ncbi:hypothetical protein [Paenibacillus larvae]|uniref:hypothetical protein n=1 Tax=Paenibacillus larvae TaxID=1464 RepID=UPI0037C7A40F